MNKDIQNTLTDEIIKKSAILYDTTYESITKVGGFENFVYEFEKNNQYYIIRYVHSLHRETNQVLAELEFIDYLDKNDARVSTVVHSINDKLLETITINDKDYFSVCVFEKAPGDRVKKEDLTDEFFEMFGEEMGKLHKLTKDYNPVHRRITWDQEPFMEICERCIPKNDEIIVKRYQETVKLIQSLPKNIDNYGLIHTDLHFGNMFISSGKLTFFDWDDSAYKHFISDIAIVLFYLFAFSEIPQEDIETKSAHILEVFLKGYRKQNSIDIDFFRYLNDFLMLRTIILYIVIHDAGEELVDSVWGKRYIEKYRDKIIHKTPFLNLKKVLRKI